MNQTMRQSGPAKTGLWIGAILMVVGVVGGIALIVVGAKSVVDTVNGYQRVNARTGGVVTFSQAARYNAYYEDPGIKRRNDIPPIQIVLTGPGGRIPLDSDINRTNTTEHYKFGDHEGVRITRFNVPKPGRYQVRVLGEPTASATNEIAFGRGSLTEGLLGVIGGVLGGGLFVLLGLVILITTAVRRSRYRKRLAQAGYGAGYGPPGTWPPAGPSPSGPWAQPTAQPGPPGPPPAWSAPWPGQGNQPNPPSQPPGWAPPPAQPPPPEPPRPEAQPTWPPPPSTPPAGSDPTNEPDRPGWGSPGR